MNTMEQASEPKILKHSSDPRRSIDGEIRSLSTVVSDEVEGAFRESAWLITEVATRLHDENFREALKELIELREAQEEKYTPPRGRDARRSVDPKPGARNG